MTIQMTALHMTPLHHNASSINVNDIYSCHSSSLVESAVAPLAKPSPTVRSISEIIIPSFSDSKAIVPTIIASLTQQASDRWTTWVTSTVPNKALLSSLGACLSHLRIVYIKPEEDARWVIWQALAQGNSHNVIAEQAHFSPSDIERMEIAAEQGQCKGMLISCS